MIRPLSERTIAVYEYIVDYMIEKTYPPTQREIAAHIGISQTSAHYHLNKLQDRGYITYPHRSSRAIELTTKKMR